MISDVLSDAVSSIDDYLTDPTFAGAYPADDPLTRRIKRCATEMDAIRAILDTPASQR